MSKDKRIIIRAGDEEKRLLAIIAEATGESESQVLRELILIGAEIVTRERLLNRYKGEQRPIKLALATDGKGEFMQFLGVVAQVLLTHDRRPLADELFEVLFPGGLGDRNLAPTEARVEYLFEAAEEINERGSKNAK